MKKPSQAYLNKLTTDLLQKEGWKLLYEDLPGGSRSGIGITSKLNSVWEQTYNLIPDLLYIKGTELLLGEVDNVLNLEYKEKFNKYNQLQDELISRISVILETKITKVTYIFISKKLNTNPPPLNCTMITFESGCAVEEILLLKN